MPNTIQAPFYPIIYVRGYAATMGEIEETVATPFMGFNLGSTKVRRNWEGKPVRFIFESPLIRLIKDFGYIDAYENGDFPPPGKTVPAKSVWIFRYYEPMSGDLGSGERLRIPAIAEQLRAFVLKVRDSVCGDDEAARNSFKVNLVAHSMGGLVCRCYLQNICKYGSPIDPSRNESLQLTAQGGDHLIHKVFTYGTPHNGIDLKGFNVPDIGSLDKIHVSNFDRDRIEEYLRLPDGSAKKGDVRSLNGAFEPDRFFCFVGTNYRDYEAFFGLSKKATGAMSDGLVMCENAYVHGAPRAYAHRAHSGHYGIVNSEEGYQNLRRFLFGQIRVDVRLEIAEITFPKNIQKLWDRGKKVRGSYQIESTARVRQGLVYLHERRVAHESAIFRTYDNLIKTPDPVYLFSGFLDRGAKSPTASDRALSFAVEVAVKAPIYEVDNRFWFDDHFEGADIFSELYLFFVRFADGQPSLRYGVGSKGNLGAGGTAAEMETHDDGRAVFRIPIPFPPGGGPRPAGRMRGTLVIEARPALSGRIPRGPSPAA